MAVPVAAVSPDIMYTVGFDDAMNSVPLQQPSNDAYCKGYIAGIDAKSANLFSRAASIDKAAADYELAIADIELYEKIKDGGNHG